MNKKILGIISGLVFAGITVAIIFFTPYEDSQKKIEAMAAAFIARFMIGFLIPNVELGIHRALVGLLLGASLSLPFAILTGAYLPIVGSGIVGGLIIGFITKRYSHL